jgi:hypothetical protein
LVYIFTLPGALRAALRFLGAALLEDKGRRKHFHRRLLARYLSQVCIAAQQKQRLVEKRELAGNQP